jgi:hypothetical protein
VVCQRCHRAPREDDPGGHVALEGLGTVYLCSPCGAEVQGQPVPSPRRYPPGTPVPRRPGSDGDIRVCAACRTALRGDEQYTVLRLQVEDLAGLDHPHGALLCCQQCTQRWRPVIFDRLKRVGVIGPSWLGGPESLGGNLLL